MSETGQIGDTVVIDLRGLICPIPVIRTQDRIKSLPSGALVDVIATDRGALNDIPAWCRIHGHEVVDAHHQDREIRIRVRVRHGV